MVIVSDQIINDVYYRLAELSEENAGALMDTMAAEQPAVLSYLMANASELDTETESEIMMFTGVVLWQCFKESNPSLPTVSEDTVDTHEQANIELMQKMDEMSMNGEVDAVQNMISEYQQEPLLQYAISALTNEEPEEEDEEAEELIGEEAQGIMLIVFKTVIDSFTSAITELN